MTLSVSVHMCVYVCRWPTLIPSVRSREAKVPELVRRTELRMRNGCGLERVLGEVSKFLQPFSRRRHASTRQMEAPLKEVVAAS